MLLAVDLGLRTGIAAYGRDGRLRRYRSQNFGTRARLRRGAGHVIGELDSLDWLIVEGDRDLGRIWGREAERRGARAATVSPERWRAALLTPSQRRSTATAKEAADGLGRAVIEWSDAPRATSLRHDAAEAILIGLWGVVAVGWLDALPRLDL